MSFYVADAAEHNLHLLDRVVVVAHGSLRSVGMIAILCKLHGRDLMAIFVGFQLCKEEEKRRAHLTRLLA